MADQNITALPAVTTPESSDQLLLVGATEEKLIDYDKLADAILGKIASKNFALDQGNKTLLQALNELNSKVVFTQKDENLKSTTEYSYSGLSITIPKGVSAVFQVKARYGNSKPLGIAITDSAENYNGGTVISQKETYPCAVIYLHSPDVKDVTYYIWTKYEQVANNSVCIGSLLFSY